MAIILNIETAVEGASICLANDEEILGLNKSASTKEQAAWMHPAIKKLVNSAGFELKQIEAVAVTNGPGSYTGLRVGLSTAKGLCYGLKKPLITIGTLPLMAAASVEKTVDFICPLIDARRMEVFTAMFDKSLLEIVKPHSLIIQENSFSSFLEAGRVFFTGNGARKLKEVLFHPNAMFSDKMPDASDMAKMAAQHFTEKKFADLAYAEPFYLKEFFSAAG